MDSRLRGNDAWGLKHMKMITDFDGDERKNIICLLQ